MTHIGLGLPIVDPATLIDWGRRAEAAGFATVAMLDRWVWDNAEPLVALAALAAATERIGLQTEVLLAPLRDPVLLAKQAATLDRISRGRLTLGLGVGGRTDDFAAANVPMRERGRRMDAALPTMRRIWRGEGTIGPAPHRPCGPEVLIGAGAPVALRRAAVHGDGVIASDGLKETEALFARARADWAAEGRAGVPRLCAQLDVVLGPEDVVADARGRMSKFYAYLPCDATTRLHAGEAAIAGAIDAYTKLGAGEITLFCWAVDPDQIERLAAVVAPSPA
ncbi:F420-dependent glucose-6-phosphate dehydrogenase [Baekduia alba]|uniref:LLM class flavin-dependent oxidoreductase n=1 Tax=Baekduia alba TaxID=2997333 RepID=UPI00233F8EA6|nr:LLM class flavin-dependent oxidoreductase [Baekduia alba]WCB94829.1 F420-dependent glucose-6-phosphate dehydrogenase [Baekduia alba]